MASRFHLAGQILNQRGRRSRRTSRQTSASNNDVDELLTSEHMVFLRNLEYVIKEQQTGGPTFREMTQERFNNEISSSHRCVIKKKAKEFLIRLRNQGSREEQRQYLTVAGAKYALKNEELSEELRIHELAIETVDESEAERQRVLNTLSTDQQCLNFAAACTSSSLLNRQQLQQNLSSFDDVVSGFSQDMREEHEHRVQQALLHDILPEQTGTIKLTEGQLEILSRAENHAPRYSFPVLYRHYCMWKNQALMNITDLLKLVRENECVIDFSKLPTTAAGLLPVSEELKERTKIRRILSPAVPGRGLIETAQYLHLGVKDALLVRSCGLVSKWHYLMSWRIVVALFPDFVPIEIRMAIGPQPGEEYDAGFLKHWHALPAPDPNNKRDLVLLLHGHIDAVMWFMNTLQSKGVPILSTLVGIMDEKTGEGVKMPTLDPFIVGTLKLERKTNTKDFTKDFVKELAILADPAKSGLSFKVLLVCMICDTPQRSECKGIIGHGGYYACERCVVRGVTTPGNSVVKYPDLDQRLRTDDQWPQYLMPDDPRADPPTKKVLLR